MKSVKHRQDACATCATLAGLVIAAVCTLVRFADGQEQSPAPQVLVRVKMIEASRTRLDRLGLDLAEVRGGRVNRVHSVVEKQDKFLSALQALEKDGLVRVLAEPRLVTVSEPEEFECLVLIAPEIVEPGRRVAGAVSGSSPR